MGDIQSHFRILSALVGCINKVLVLTTEKNTNTSKGNGQIFFMDCNDFKTKVIQK